jgi:glycosyltransferase involved in cell wall biosynthesis
MRVCLFGTYQRHHSANRLLRRALQAAGHDVEELHEPLWEETPDKPASYFGPASLARLGARYALAGRRLARGWRARSGEPPLVVVGFGGHLDVLLAERVCRPRRGLVFAPLVSLSETLVEDRQVFRPGSWRARRLGDLDRRAFAASDLVLADTVAHAEYLSELGVPRASTAVWHLGFEPEFLPAPPPREGAARVLFYGRYLPLHGIETIVRAAALLGPYVELVLLGSGPERPRVRSLAADLGLSVTWRDPVPLTALPAELSRAAVVLGVFGASRKAAMVVPNKVYQAAAHGAALVTRDGPALREVLGPGEHCLVCPPDDPQALAAQVRTLLDDPDGAARLGRAARAHVLESFGPTRQAQRLDAILAERFGCGTGAEVA